MARSSRRSSQPSDPQAIALRRAAERAEAAARERAAERAAVKSPGAWGVSPELTRLATSGDIDVTRDRKTILAARRRDPFDDLHARGGLSHAEHQAARRLLRDLALRVGIVVEDRRVGIEALGVRVQAARNPTAGSVTGESLAAAARVRGAMTAVGLASARLLTAVAGPLIDLGWLDDWRGVVARVTGETDAVAQGCCVRQACAALVLHYRAVEMAPRTPLANDDAPIQVRDDARAG